MDTMGVLLERNHMLMKLNERRDWFLQKSTFPKKVNNGIIFADNSKYNVSSEIEI